MKRHLGCFLLAADASLGKVAAVLAAMAAAQTGIFLWQTTGEGAAAQQLEWIFDSMLMRGTASLALTFAALLMIFSAGGGGMTVHRLPAGRRWMMFWWTVYSLFVFLLCWAVQLLTAFSLCRWYCARLDTPLAGQAEFLAFYESGYLHTILPLADTGQWWVTVILYMGLGLGCGGAAALQWSGRSYIAAPVLAAATWLSAGGLERTGWSILLAAAALVLGVWGIAAAWEEGLP